MKITGRWLASGLGVLALIVATTVLVASRNPVKSSQVPTIKIDGKPIISILFNSTKVKLGQCLMGKLS